MLHTKNYQNRLMFHKVISFKIKMARFLLRHNVLKKLDSNKKENR